MGTRIHIGHLSYDVRERDVEKFFERYGPINGVVLKNGFGFVDFDDSRDADEAVYELDGKELLGQRVTVAPARGPTRRNDYGGGFRGRNWRTPARRGGVGREKYGPPTRTNYRLIVENLSSGVSWQDLKDFMRQAGEVTYADAHKKRRSEGVVEFGSYSDMKNAIQKFDNSDLNGRRIRLSEDKSHREGSRSRLRSKSRTPSRSRYHSRSRSHSKSRSKSRSRSPLQSRSKSKSKTQSKSRCRSRSRSHSKSRSKSRSRSPLQSRSKSRTPSRSRSRSRSRSISKSRSKFHLQSRSKSRSPSRSRSRSRSKSRGNSRSPSKSRSKSPEVQSKFKAKSRVKSPSMSPAEDGEVSPDITDKE